MFGRTGKAFLAGMVSGSGLVGIAFQFRPTSKEGIQDGTVAQPVLTGAPSERIDRYRDIMRYGIPVLGPKEVLFYENHILRYSLERRSPVWVAEHLSTAELKGHGDVNRKYSKFKADTTVPAPFRAQPNDYVKSGWSQGHMVPAADCKQNQKAMDETFLLTNIVPQDLDNNKNYWAMLEGMCRDLTKQYDDVHVISGPLYLPQVEADGRRFVRYQVLGDANIAVPTHLFKVVVASRSNRPPAVGAFIIPNRPVPSGKALTDFQVSLEELERRLGGIVYPDLDRFKTVDLCTGGKCRLFTWETRARMHLVHQLTSAKSLESLEKAWHSAAKKGLKPDRGTTEIYLQRKKTLSQ